MTLTVVPDNGGSHITVAALAEDMLLCVRNLNSSKASSVFCLPHLLQKITGSGD